MDTIAEEAGLAGAPRSPGSILAAERERQGLSRADIAQRLHMSVSQVEALELGDYERLPRGTFLRGFTRNYARVLGLDGEDLVARLAEDAPRERAPGIVVPSQNIRFDPLGARLANPYVKAAGIAAVAIVLGFAAMYWWLFVRPQGAASVAPPRPAASASPRASSLPVEAPKGELPGESPALPAGSVIVPHDGAAPPAEAARAPEPGSTATPPALLLPQALSPAPTYSPAPAIPAAPVLPAATPAPAKAAPEAPAAVAGLAPLPAGAKALRLAFKGSAWVEIVDGRRRTLVSRTHPAGTEAEVAGVPPFSLVIGNAPEVKLVYDGRDVDLAPHTKVAVARFTLP